MAPSSLISLRNRVLSTRLSPFIAKSFETVNPGTVYYPNWHIDLIAEYLEAVERSEITRFIINMPPRALKSISVSVAWTAYLLGRNPAMRIMCASYSAALAVRHSLDTRLVMTQPWYGDVFPRTELMEGENQKHKFVTTARGFRFATSVGGTATGEGGDVLIVDDPLNPSQAASRTERTAANHWYDQTFSTRLNDKRTGRIVIVMQRLHTDDLSGHLLAKGGWEQLVLPAIAERSSVHDFGRVKKHRAVEELLHTERDAHALIQRARTDLGSAAFAAQYQQEPLPESGHMIAPHWLRKMRAEATEFTRIIQSWDTGIKSDPKHDASACITIGECADGYVVLDALACRVEYPDLKRTVVQQAERWKPDALLIEDKASGQSLLQELRRETTLPLIAILPKQDKVTRVARISSLLEAGKVSVPKYAAWLPAFERELFAFPNAAHDDMVDALTQGLTWLQGGDRKTPSIRWL